MIGASATTKAVIASKGSDLQAFPDDAREAAVETIRAFSDADLNVAKAAERMHVHPNTVRYRLKQIATRPVTIRAPSRASSTCSASSS